MASGHLEVVIPSSLGAGQLHSSLVEARNVDVAHNSDSDDASDDLQDEQVAAEVLLEKNWKRYRLRAKKRQVELDKRAHSVNYKASNVIFGLKCRV